MSQKALADAVGIKQPTLSELETGESKGTTNSAVFAAALGVNALWLETGKGSKYGAAQDEGSYKISNIRAVFDEETNPDIYKIKKVQIKISAGISGFSISQEIESDAPIYFRKSWIDSKGYKPENLVAIHVHGSSMEPGLYDGDTIVINTKDTEPAEGEVFAVNYEGELVVKRLFRDAGTWILSSDNSDKRKYPNKIAAGDLCLIIGKVIHKQSERV